VAQEAASAGYALQIKLDSTVCAYMDQELGARALVGVIAIIAVHWNPCTTGNGRRLALALDNNNSSYHCSHCKYTNN
jgi:transposase-like protein